MNTKTRLKIKSISWGTLVLLITTTIVFTALCNWLLAIGLGALSALQETTIYYFHGKPKSKDFIRYTPRRK